MNDRDNLPGNEPPASPNEKRLAQFAADVMKRYERGQPIRVGEMLADRPDLFEEAVKLVPALQSLHERSAGAPAPEEAVAATLVRQGEQPLPPPLRQLGLYELLRRLGAPSGQGEVWLARHTMLKVLCAVKILRPNRSGHDALARFRREMEAQAQLEHPNIVGIRHAEVIAGQPILVMKYIDGFSLQELVQRHGPLPVGDACELIRQAAVGLAFAHEHGIVHRDVKPGNLMLDRTLTVKVLDFGLARGGSAGEPLTQEGDLLGTPEYLAPEQAGRATQVDIRADLYGLGCTLFFLLTGKPPYPRKGTALADLLAVLKDHEEAPVPSLRARRPDIPPALAALIETKLLAKKPADRLPTPRHLVAALRPFVRGHKLGQLIGVTAPLVEQAVGGVPDGEVSRDGSAPLDAALELVFWDATAKRRAGIDEPGVLPVKSGDEFRIEVRLNRPAFVYLIWIDGQGNIAPVYPWKPESEFPDWEAPVDERATTALSLPLGDDGAVLPIEGAAGVETLVLLARDEPLSRQEHERFTGWLPPRLPRLGSLSHPDRPRWLTCRQEECEPPQEKGHEAYGVARGIGKRKAPADPLFQFDTLLRERLGPRFQLLQAVSFTNQGAKGEQS